MTEKLCTPLQIAIGFSDGEYVKGKSTPVIRLLLDNGADLKDRLQMGEDSQMFGKAPRCNILTYAVNYVFKSNDHGMIDNFKLISDYNQKTKAGLKVEPLSTEVAAGEEGNKKIPILYAALADDLDAFKKYVKDGGDASKYIGYLKTAKSTNIIQFIIDLNLIDANKIKELKENVLGQYDAGSMITNNFIKALLEFDVQLFESNYLPDYKYFSAAYGDLFNKAYRGKFPQFDFINGERINYQNDYSIVAYLLLNNGKLYSDRTFNILKYIFENSKFESEYQISGHTYKLFPALIDIMSNSDYNEEMTFKLLDIIVGKMAKYNEALDVCSVEHIKPYVQHLFDNNQMNTAIEIYYNKLKYDNEIHEEKPRDYYGAPTYLLDQYHDKTGATFNMVHPVHAYF
jgi:hypothetical protein